MKKQNFLLGQFSNKISNVYNSLQNENQMKCLINGFEKKQISKKKY